MIQDGEEIFDFNSIENPIHELIDKLDSLRSSVDTLAISMGQIDFCIHDGTIPLVTAIEKLNTSITGHSALNGDITLVEVIDKLIIAIEESK